VNREVILQDNKLHKLSKIKAPAPHEDAQRHAINAALNAFEEQEQTKAQTAPEKEITKKTQGSWNPLRLIHRANNKLWSNIMKKRFITGTALASVLAIVMVGTIPQDGFLRDADTNLDNTYQSIGSALQSPAGRKSNDGTVYMTMPKIKRVESRSANDILGNKSDRNVGRVYKKAKLSLPAYSPPKPAHWNSYANNNADYEMAPQRNNDKFVGKAQNPIKLVTKEPVSTFSVDVDTASYTYMRKSINNGSLPSADAVRIEELINYFDYNYELPKTAQQPFQPTVAIYPTPWNTNTKLMHIGIKGHDIIPTEKPKANLVFLLDVSGSMSAQNKLPLLKSAFKMMVENLSEDDTVSIVTYAGRAATVLEPTKVANKQAIINALDNLKSGGSTAGAQGIKTAYDLAQQNYDEDGVNRVILATDGDFNVGITNRDELKKYIEKKRKSGVFLSILGFGMGNYNDALMQTLAQNGNGNAAYIDNLNEARKVLVDEAGSTLFTIAKDVKLQVEFNPNLISEYRLVGYETRMLNREDFNNDKVDAGDIGSGHSVTAIYEITPKGAKGSVDELRYQKEQEVKTTESGAFNDEYAFLKMRYKLPNEDVSKLIKSPVTKEVEFNDIAKANSEIRFAASVAAFGPKLKGSVYAEDISYDEIIKLASNAKASDKFGYRAEFVNLVRLAKALK